MACVLKRRDFDIPQTKQILCALSEGLGPKPREEKTQIPSCKHMCIRTRISVFAWWLPVAQDQQIGNKSVTITTFENQNSITRLLKTKTIMIK